MVATVVLMGYVRFWFLSSSPVVSNKIEIMDSRAYGSGILVNAIVFYRRLSYLAMAVVRKSHALLKVPYRICIYYVCIDANFKSHDCYIDSTMPPRTIDFILVGQCCRNVNDDAKSQPNITQREAHADCFCTNAISSSSTKTSSEPSFSFSGDASLSISFVGSDGGVESNV